MARWIEWMCTVCGTKTGRSARTGRPRNNGKPHRWVKNRES